MDQKRYTVNLDIVSWGFVLESIRYCREDTISSMLANKRADKLLEGLNGSVAARLNEISQSVYTQLNHQGCRHFHVVRDGDYGDEQPETEQQQ